MSNYPELDKLNNDYLKIMDELIEYLESKGYSIVKFREGGSMWDSMNWGKERSRFFGADPVLIEKERKDIHKKLKKLNN